MKTKNDGKNREIDLGTQKKADKLQNEIEEKYQNILRNIHEAYFEVDLVGNLTFFNNSFCKILRYPPKEMTGMSYKKYADKETAKIIFQTYNNVYKTGEPAEAIDWQFIRKDGVKIFVDESISLHRDASGNIIGFRGMVRDTTERKNAEENLRKSEKMYSKLVDTIPDAVIHSDLNGDIIFVNNHTLKISGYSRDELVGKNILNFISPEYHNSAFKNILLMIEGKLGPLDPLVEYQLIMKNGAKLFFEVNSDILTNDDGTPFGVVYLCRDMSERKKAEDDLINSEKLYRLLADHVTDIIFTLDMNLRFSYISPSVKLVLGYTSDETMTRKLQETVSPATFNYLKGVLLEEIEIEKRTDRIFRGPRVIEYKHIHKNGSEIWMEATLTFLRDKHKAAVGILGIVRDISRRKQAEIALENTLENLRKALGTTIQVMVSAVEMKDPYTAGHQIRTAEIATAIAKEMGLPSDTVDGIRMAGSIHDIGKLSIPTEILSKPTKLTHLEFTLIKEHPKSGFEILKNIESPWPLAEIVHQHHERMDGSGYPKKLKGNDIILEARIMAVSDVVEAMASHRPYRASLGIEAALEEIEKNRGLSYDEDVVDACLRLFREKDYRLT